MDVFLKKHFSFDLNPYFKRQVQGAKKKHCRTEGGDIATLEN